MLKHIRHIPIEYRWSVENFDEPDVTNLNRLCCEY